MNNRAHRKTVAEHTLQILEGETWTIGENRISIQPELESCKQRTELFRPDDSTNVEDSAKPSVETQTRVEVRNETTFAGARSLLENGAEKVCALNFASAKNPGGGFLGGSQAQEEALARASGLYASLLCAPEYYEANRKSRNALYTNHLIYSPDVPVFRDDSDQLLAQPWLVSIITSPAVNAGALLRNHPHLEDQIRPVMQGRIRQVLGVAFARGHTDLVLGAWGCGVFRNDPVEIATLFREELEFANVRGRFQNVRFSVLARGVEEETLKAFEEQFA